MVVAIIQLTLKVALCLEMCVGCVACHWIRLPFAVCVFSPNFIFMFPATVGGCGHGGRRPQLREYIAKERIDFVALQETIKADFTFRDLLA